MERSVDFTLSVSGVSSLPRSLSSSSRERLNEARVLARRFWVLLS